MSPQTAGAAGCHLPPLTLSVSPPLPLTPTLPHSLPLTLPTLSLSLLHLSRTCVQVVQLCGYVVDAQLIQAEGKVTQTLLGRVCVWCGVCERGVGGGGGEETGVTTCVWCSQLILVETQELCQLCAATRCAALVCGRKLRAAAV